MMLSWIDSPQQMWVYDEDAGMNCRDVTFVPGLYKIFDEILGKWITHNLRPKLNHKSNVFYLFFNPTFSKCSWQ